MDHKRELYFLSGGDFVSRGEKGQPYFLADGEKSEYSMYQWIKILNDQILLEPDDRVKEVLFSIQVPQDASPGGHYGAIYFSDIPSHLELRQSSGVAVGSKLAVLILVEVEGEIEETGRIIEFKTENNKIFFSSLPIKYLIRFENLGNIHLKPGGKIFLENTFGKQSQKLTKIAVYDEQGIWQKDEILDYVPVNFEKGNVLPQSIRQFEAIWQGENVPGKSSLANEWRDFRFGRYKSRLVVSYGREGKTIELDGPIVWLFPWRILAIFVFFVLAVVWVLVVLGKKRRRS